MAKKQKKDKKADVSPKERDSRPTRSSLRLNFEAVCQAVILALFVRTFVAEAYKIPTTSMVPTLLVGDHLVVNKLVYRPTLSPVEKSLSPTRSIRRGDIIVFRSPIEPETNVVKRVIGLPNERLRIEQKKVFINDEVLDEPYAHFQAPDKGDDPNAFYEMRGDNFSEITIPADHYFMMGDNRDNSYDSRYWGPLPGDLVRGRALMVYWSYDATTEEYLETNLVKKVKNLFSTVFHFFSRTRWGRTFHLPH
jgi:signal peptidase I